MAVFTEIDWAKRKDRYWSNFFNTLSGARSSVLIGTSNAQGQHNLAIFNSLVHLGANPPLLGFILRPATVPRGTYENILTNKYYTLNHISEAMINAAHQTSAKYENGESEFDATGLTSEFGASKVAPFVKESPIKILMEFQEEHLVMNGTRLIVGQVKEVVLNESVIEEDGSIKVAEENLIATSGLYHYHSVKFKVKKDFARP
ncbi:flavin reductase family protein [Salibacteraceae bacterium]|jgi:flavin reductase (DIM6/NTAB) family NADH-FMN oxidoreductase RutF|nr:flavin reductase family protein [Salibacteraceae bacterium]MDB9708410.1 flavin reductase family protein [Salibacteraceae bacterium]HAQ72065.1 flavin oxidoreductase [Flavobacteriales bacterium]